MNYNNKKTLNDIDFNNKTTLVRVDYNVPLFDGVITDANRIKATIPTINFLVEKNAKIVLFSHFSRIKSEEDKVKKTLAPVAKKLSEILNKEVKFVSETKGTNLEEVIKNLKAGEICLVENTRFEDVANGEFVNRESKNDPSLGKYWASLGDVFVNDAFGTSHREHASNVGIASNIKESAVGFLIEKELKMLTKAVENPARPFISILGGAKVSDKIGVIENLLEKCDKIIIGGGMTYTFWKAMGKNIGDSLLEESQIENAKRYLSTASDKIIVPVDSKISKEFKDTIPEVAEGNIPDGFEGMDMGPKSVENMIKELNGAKTIIWNGPLGVAEFSNYKQGTFAACEKMAELTKEGAYTLIGGGDSGAAAINFGFEDKISWISTGGGASLKFFEGKPLPGIEVINSK